MKFWIQYGDAKVTVEQEGDCLTVYRYTCGDVLYTAAVYHYSQLQRAVEYACTLMSGIRGAF